MNHAHYLYEPEEKRHFKSYILLVLMNCLMKWHFPPKHTFGRWCSHTSIRCGKRFAADVRCVNFPLRIRWYHGSQLHSTSIPEWLRGWWLRLVIRIQPIGVWKMDTQIKQIAQIIHSAFIIQEMAQLLRSLSIFSNEISRSSATTIIKDSLCR